MKKSFNEIIKPVLVLVCICLVVTALLAYINSVTSPIIAKAEQEKAKACNTINCNKAEEEELFFVSSVPWFDYTSVIQPVPMPADGNPRLTWGKYFTRCGRTYLPFTILCNHAIVDGRHLGLFFEALSDSIREVNELLSKQIDG